MKEEYYLYTFESTHGAIATEKFLKPIGGIVMPVPRHISTSCGISVRIAKELIEKARAVFDEKNELPREEYQLYHIYNDPNDQIHGFHFEKYEV